jgi:hypothetical protein
MRSLLLYFNSLSVPMKLVPRATLGTRAVGPDACCTSISGSTLPPIVKQSYHILWQIMKQLLKYP